ncbi:MAG: DUF58 domain-containing protein [Clostridia bacterium]|nr:DUF58 domain-containing protein [Clostridia bacterium]
MAKELIDDKTIALLDGRDFSIRSLMEGLFGGNRRSAYYGSSMEFADYRPYIPGDDPRRIDWNLYGRTDGLFLKLFTDERRQHHRVYIDGSASMAWGKPEKHLTALRLAALLGYLAVSGSDRVSWYALERDECRRVTEPVSTRESWVLALDGLGALTCGGDTRMDVSVPRCPDPGYKDGISFLISDFLTDRDWKSAVDWLLSREREVCLIRVLSPDETAPELRGKLRLRDIEATGEDDERNFRMHIGKQRLRAYAEACAWLERDIRTFCDARQIRFFTCMTDEPVAKILFDGAVRSEMVR